MTKFSFLAKYRGHYLACVLNNFAYDLLEVLRACEEMELLHVEPNWPGKV